MVDYDGIGDSDDASHTPTTPITYEQSFLLPENQFEEIVRGELRLIRPASLAHDRLLRRLERILEAQLEHHEVLGPGVGLGISKVPFTYRVPDKMVFHVGIYKRADNPTYIWEPPVLIAECLSPANRKSPVEELLKDYKSPHVQEVWLLKPEELICEVYSGDHLETVFTQRDGILSLGRIAQVRITMLWEAFHD